MTATELQQLTLWPDDALPGQLPLLKDPPPCSGTPSPGQIGPGCAFLTPSLSPNLSAVRLDFPGG